MIVSVQQVSLNPTWTYVELRVGLVTYGHGQQHHQTSERDVPRALDGLPCVLVKVLTDGIDGNTLNILTSRKIGDTSGFARCGEAYCEGRFMSQRRRKRESRMGLKRLCA